MKDTPLDERMELFVREAGGNWPKRWILDAKLMRLQIHKLEKDLAKVNDQLQIAMLEKAVERQEDS